MASLIFDFDGTLADTFPLIVDVSYRLSRQTKRRSRAEIDELRRLPLLAALLRLGIPWIYVPRLVLSTRKNLTEHMQQVQPFDGVPAMLRALHQAGHQLFILSSNYPKNIQLFLAQHGLAQYVTGVEGVYWANTWTKTRALRRLIKKYDLKSADCYHVGNEALDMWAAKLAGIRGVAVTWSGHDNRALKAAGAETLVDKPKDLLGFFAERQHNRSARD